MSEKVENYLKLGEHMVRIPTARNNAKFVSYFRINGQPIMPPLMTTEKRRHMEKIREKAIKLERFYAERRNKRETIAGGGSINIPPFDLHDEETIGTPHSQSSYALAREYAQQQADAKACELLVEMMNNTNIETPQIQTQGQQTEDDKEDKVERYKKLQKSQTLVYDNSTNQIIMPLEEYQEDLAKKANEPNTDTDGNETLTELDDINNNNGSCGDYLHKTSGDETVRVTSTNSMLPNIPTIPSIYVNPPTPMVDNRSLTDALSYADSVENMMMLEDTATTETTDSSSNSSSVQLRMKSSEEMQRIQNLPGQVMPNIDTNNEMMYVRRSATSPALKNARLTRQVLTNLPTNTNNNNIAEIAGITRSNSFTVDSPSNALIEHMKQQEPADGQQTKRIAARCITNSTDQTTYRAAAPKVSTATRDTVESRAKRVTKVETKQKAKSGKSAKAGLPKLHQNLFKTTKSPYDTRLAKAVVVAATATNSKSSNKKHSNPKLSASTSQKPKKPIITPTPTPSNVNITVPPPLAEVVESSNTQNNVLTTVASQVLGDIEAAHREKFLKLLAEQNAEQQRLQLAFEAQQRLLLEQLSKEFTTAQMQSSTQPSEMSIDCMTPRSCSGASTISSVSLCSSILSPRRSRNPMTTAEMPMMDGRNVQTINNGPANDNFSPRRRLFPVENQTSVPSSVGGDATFRTSSPSCKSEKLKSVQDSFQRDIRRDNAATIINAYARGFLVRRLFRAEQIQRIVQTIRDTLIFVINLHMETRDNEEANTAANIRLKARLLQQLSSATRTLHLVFFQTTLKERMEIIRRDRNRIKTKLLTNNMRRTSPRIPGST